MKIIEDRSSILQTFDIGGKANYLAILQKLGLNVPKWFVIPAKSLSDVINLDNDSDNYQILKFIDAYEFDPEFIEEINKSFSENTFYAVRSSAIGEDGSEHSYAGQFESFLFVPKDQIADKIKKVWKSAYSDRVGAYRKHNKINTQPEIAIIIQEMVNAEVSGVAFGINPANGDRNAQVISAVFGLGEGLVSGELDADNFIVTTEAINSEIALKTHQLVFDQKSKNGLDKIELNDEVHTLPTLKEDQIREITDTLELCAKYFGRPQDIEFAIADEQLYILQARPVTNLNKIADRNENYLLWDNSNIIESYPGVTTPLTFSFISKSYEGAYKLFSGFMGVSESMIKKNERVFANTLGLINGRVYYNLRTWYEMLAMLPGYSINARFMEKMMGVKERFDIPDSYRLSKTQAWWSIVKMAFQMIIRLFSLTKKRKDFKLLLDSTIASYKSIDLGSKTSNELLDLYLKFEKTLLNQWIAPLLNDFFAMVFFGTLQKTVEKYQVSDNPNIHNDLLCGSADIISTQPIHRTIELSTSILKDEALADLFINNSEEEIWESLNKEVTLRNSELKQSIDRYIVDFGERCVGELKLETTSFTQNPVGFIKVLKSYVVNKIDLKSTSGKVEQELRNRAEAEVEKTLRNKFFKKWYLKKILNKTRELVSARENLRYERTRAFGIVREIFSHIGKRWYFEGIIFESGDIFYLTKEEISAFIEGRSVTQNIKSLIQIRKEEFEKYRKIGPLSERFGTYGVVYHANDFFSSEKSAPLSGELKGIGCSPGRVKAKVRVVTDPAEIESLDGDILVTTSTDPGWVTLFPSASGIIVERGSLLSHSAIVSREMGKPCIVSVTGLLKTLKTGDEIEMDGSSGEIKIIKNTA